MNGIHTSSTCPPSQTYCPRLFFLHFVERQVGQTGFFFFVGSDMEDAEVIKRQRGGGAREVVL